MNLPFLLTELSVQMMNEEGKNVRSYVRPPPRMDGPPLIFVHGDPDSSTRNNVHTPAAANLIVSPHAVSIRIVKRKKTYTVVQYSDLEDENLLQHLYNNMEASLRWPPAPGPPASGLAAPGPPTPRPTHNNF